ncbi:MAG: D-amino-acid transaminase [Rhodospirillaceae bacterium]|nr:D-amino-acid transaminase [Rhodospirillaceae bacterium]
MSHIAYVNGRYLPQKHAQIHIEDRGHQFADGVYEVICIWHGMPADYAAHVARLNRSLKELAIRPPVSNGALAFIVREVVRRNWLDKGTVYIQINRGVAPRAHAFPSAAVKPSLIVTARHGAGPAETVARAGVKVISLPDTRWKRCDIKSVGLLPNALAKQAAAEAKAFEALLLTPEGTVTEASVSNAWMVTPERTIVTHPETSSILAGVTRGRVLKIARAAGYAVEERPFTLAEARKAKEVFLTGTTTFVMPVVQIDGQPVANGVPGTVACELRQRYQGYIDSLAADLSGSAWNA